ncbi:hypothetical protein R3P38DRAFT_3134054 [Favolaschia claudopus]|uniref:Uncharacterized protein n=1 Tax=Favolaschia claudopus TaxID=2862362 RepID=A0AAV9Z6Y0_9AGAR
MTTSTSLPVIVPATAPIVARHLTKTKVFHEDDVYPPPLPVLLKDTDFPLPVFEPLYANTTPILGVEPPLRLPQINASTPFDGIDPVSEKNSLPELPQRANTPRKLPERTPHRVVRIHSPYPLRASGSRQITRRESSPLSPPPEETVHHYPPRAPPITIPRPTRVQENYTTSLDAHLSKPMHEKLKAAFDDAAPNFLNLSRSFTEQDSGDIEKFKAEMHRIHPVLKQFEQDWAFQGIVTNLLRNRKASRHREQAAELAAIASGKKINERTKAPRRSVV